MMLAAAVVATIYTLVATVIVKSSVRDTFPLPFVNNNHSYVNVVLLITLENKNLKCEFFCNSSFQLQVPIQMQ